MMKRSFVKSRLSLAAIAAALLLFSCGDKPLFDELATNRLRVVIKGTFESNSPRPWSLPANPNIRPDMEDFSVNDLIGPLEDTDLPSVFYLDLAELQLDKKRFANYRQVFTLPLTDTEPFFNGTGMVLRNDDPPTESYSSVRVFIRKMIFNNATKYYQDTTSWPNWIFDGNAETIFNEKEIQGFNFNSLQVNSYYDSLLLQAGDINRVFPIKVPIEGGLAYDPDEPETVLEIRLVVKNFVKKYEGDYYDEESRHALYHFYGLSDWLNDVQADENTLGGNLHAAARVYVPGETATISGTAPAGYVIAIPADKDISDYFIPAGDRTRPEYSIVDPTELYKQPREPFLPVDTIESVLDYYLKAEQYKSEYNLFVNGVDDSGTMGGDTDGFDYDSEWTAYEGRVGVFRIPPLVTWSDGSFTLQNIPLGSSLDIYTVPGGVPYGELPDDTDCTFEETITVNGDVTGKSY